MLETARVKPCHRHIPRVPPVCFATPQCIAAATVLCLMARVAPATLLAHKHCNCPAVDAPLPSVRSARGREEFLQTPAFVIAAHYTRGDTLRSQTHAKELRDKLRQTARFQVRAQGFLNGLEG